MGNSPSGEVEETRDERAAKRLKLDDSSEHSATPVTIEPAEIVATDSKAVTQVTEKNLEIFTADLPEGAQGLAIPDTVVASNAATVADSVATAPVRTVPAEVAAGDSAPLTQVTEKNLEIFTAGLPEGAQGLAIPDTVVPSNVATVSESVAVASGNDKDTTMNIDDRAPEVESSKTDDRGRTHGVAHIKAEYVLPKSEVPSRGIFSVDDDAAEGRGNEQPGASNDRRANGRGQQGKDKRKQRGQNTNRTYGELGDYIKLCNSRAFYNEFSPRECKFGDRCKLCHDLRKYLEEGKRRDLDVFGGKCIVFETYGRCPSGWKCRFVGSHSKEVELEDGNTELVLMGSTLPLHEGMAVNLPLKGLQKQQEHAALAETTGSDEAVGKPDDVPVKDDGLEQPNADLASHVDDATEKPEGAAEADESKPAEHKEGTKNENSLEKAEEEDARPGIVNKVSTEIKFSISRKKIDMTRADEYINWLHLEGRLGDDQEKRRLRQQTGDLEEMRAQYKEPPFKPSEKRKIYFGPETPVLAPLTTQGNIPFRRLCVELGAQATYSEMAMGQGLLQGTKVDWTLLRAHQTEIRPPKINFDTANIVQGYDHARDLKYGVQISANQPWIATKTADILNRFVPHVRVIDLNCGCPIDMVYKSGGGSGLLDHPAKLERMVRGMNALSGEIPITVKLRTGVRTNRPTASTTIGRLAFGGRDVRDRLGAPGCAAITLHGRSREARYTKTANWEYIAECANMIRTYNSQKAYLTDTVAEPDESTLANSKDGRMFFLGNGDCFSHVEYYNHTEKAKVDSVMIGRGALVKPWLFEEIEKGQYLDKSSSERLAYIEKFVRYGLEAWGSDELGIGYTRRFLLEWMSFACRYVPIGILEHLPPALNARPPPFRGRDELETLMASDNYRDWIKISEMFLGPTQEGFRFQPKHKSNSYDTEG